MEPAARPTRRQWLAVAGAAAGAVLGGRWLRFLRERHEERLRPPGALPEGDFLAACIRCGQCVNACPYETLFLCGLEAGLLDVGTPSLDTRRQPCWLCRGEETLRCIEVCPTDALQPVNSLRDIRMGVAEIDADRCFAWNGVVCRACWHACPFPDEAIVLDELGRARVVAEACIGCGICDQACLTAPSSIRILP